MEILKFVFPDSRKTRESFILLVFCGLSMGGGNCLDRSKLAQSWAMPPFLPLSPFLPCFLLSLVFFVAHFGDQFLVFVVLVVLVVLVALVALVALDVLKVLVVLILIGQDGILK